MKPEPVHTVQAWVCQSKVTLDLILQCKVRPLLVNNIQCYSAVGNTDSIYIVVIPSGDILEKYGLGH